MTPPTIFITLEGVSSAELERCREMIHRLFSEGVFALRNGKAILSFDNHGLLAEIEIDVKKWSRKYDGEPKVEINSLKQFKIEMTPDQSTVAKST